MAARVKPVTFELGALEVAMPDGNSGRGRPAIRPGEGRGCELWITGRLLIGRTIRACLRSASSLGS
jgi:hypothetical protein